MVRPLSSLRVSGATLTFCCFNLLFSIRKWWDPYVSLFRFYSSDVPLQFNDNWLCWPLSDRGSGPATGWHVINCYANICHGIWEQGFVPSPCYWCRACWEPPPPPPPPLPCQKKKRKRCLPSGSKKAGSLLQASSSKRTEGSSMVQKFQLEPTLPMVPDRIVHCVLQRDYVDMAELTEENLELELHRSTDSDEVKSIPLSKFKPVPDVSARPSKAQDLLADLATLLAGAEKGDWWRTYDSRFRQQLPALELAEFGRLGQALFTRTIFSSGGAGISQRGGHAPQPESRNPPAAKRRRVASCFAWNDGKSCVATPCRYSDIWVGSIARPRAHHLLQTIHLFLLIAASDMRAPHNCTCIVCHVCYCC